MKIDLNQNVIFKTFRCRTITSLTRDINEFIQENKSSTIVDVNSYYDNSNDIYILSIFYTRN